MMSTSVDTPKGIQQVPRFIPPPETCDYDPAPMKPPLRSDDCEVTNRRLVQTKTEFETPGGVTPIQLRNDNHAFILINITHRDHRPRSIYPGFRILGAFPSISQMEMHIEQHYKGSECSLFATPTHELMVICESTEKQQDGHYNKKHTESLVELHSKFADNQDEDFKANIQESKTGETGKSLFARKLKTNAKTSHRVELIESKFEQTITELKKTNTLPATCCIAKQNFAAVIILSDLRPTALNGEEDKEPVIAVLGVFATEDECTNYAKFTASKQYPKCAIDVVDMYSWCFPEDVDTEKIKEVYGNDQLNDIMQGRKDQTHVTEKFQDWCKENKIEPQVTEIGNELESPDSVDVQLKKKDVALTFHDENNKKQEEPC